MSEGPRMDRYRVVNLSRRAFLQSSGVALVVGLAPVVGLHAAGETQGPDATALGPWIRIDADDRVTLVCPDCEMGQGVYTGLPLILAEEFDCDFEQVQIEFSTADAAYNNPRKGYIATGGSLAVRGYFDLLRNVGASARAMLVAAAAAEWGVSADSLRTQSGHVIDDASGRRVAYGALAARAALLEPPS
ncbi:MAG TPA: molybdopterin cofactor-binding domain-containing protein, partial [Steroidobacteraceae bacterium]|nr:molybdopterin cofactor-binding domain-containing protein [Steroidobacteraceae bacterium]